MRILFFGTPKTAVPFLERLHQAHTVAAVVCQPDEPAGRGYKVTPPPTKIFALRNGLPVFQPTGKWSDEDVERLRGYGADLGVAVAYGRIMPRPVFGAPRLGTVNVHFSLLPKYRGAAPMQWALINGETETGVSIFWIEEGLDSGPVSAQRAVPIEPGDRMDTLREKLTAAGLQALEGVVVDCEKGSIRRVSQTGTPTLAPLLKKEDGRIDWTLPAARVSNLIAGVVEWPGATTLYRTAEGEDRRLKILAATPGDGAAAGSPGEVVAVDKEKGIGIKAADRVLWLSTVQPEGKKAMDAFSFWNGARLKIGDTLG